MSAEELLAEAVGHILDGDTLRAKILELAPCRLSESELDAIVDYIANVHQGLLSSMELALSQIIGHRRIREAVIHEQLLQMDAPLCAAP